MSTVMTKPKYDPYTHCSVRCSVCGEWLPPFELLNTDETDKSVRARIWFSAHWQVNRLDDGLTYCSEHIPTTTTDPVSEQPPQPPQPEQKGLWA